MIEQLFMSIKQYAFIWFCCFVIFVLSSFHIYSVYEGNLWFHTSGTITYVKEVSNHNFLYTIEYMTQTDGAQKKVRLFKHDILHPFKGQEVKIKYRKNNIQDFIILSVMKYMPETTQDKL
ncbi:MAG TPA: hypothetical protein DIC42_00620 [Holosporales bacterium]|nr:hypothetical protein [Holosporales bacterium]